MGLLNHKNRNEDKKTVEKMSWIFAAENDLEQVMKVLCSAFGTQREGSGNTLTLNNKDLHIEASACTKTMSEESGKYVQGQVKNVWGHFHEVETAFLDTKINLLHQLRMTSSVIEITYRYEEDVRLDKEMMILRPFLDSLPVLKGVFITESGTVILGEKGQLILSDKGDSKGDPFLPYERDLPQSVTEQEVKESTERRRQSMGAIKSRQIYVPSWLPLLETEEETHFRTPEEIAGRSAALLAVSLYSECLLAENMGVEKAREFVQSVIDQFSAEQYLSPAEKTYLENSDSIDEERIKYSWQYEDVFVMEWALGLIEELPFPDKICDVPLTVKVLNEFSSMEEFLNHVRLKTPKELLDMADFIFRLDWACVDARINGLPAPAGMDGGVVMERHKSLNWLIGFLDSAPWDEVETPT